MPAIGNIFNNVRRSDILEVLVVSTTTCVLT